MKKPNFRLRKIYSDGNTEPPALYEINDFDGDWMMGRRGFLVTASIGIGIISGCAKNCYVWDENTLSEAVTMHGQCEDEIYAHSSHVTELAFSPNGDLLASGGYEGDIKVWEIPSGKLLTSFSVPARKTACDNPIKGLAFTNDGKLIACLAENNDDITIWEVSSGNLFRTIKLQQKGIHTWITWMFLDPNKNLLFAGERGFDDRIKIWQIPDGKLLGILEQKRDRNLLEKLTGFKGSSNINVLVTNPDGNLLISGKGIWPGHGDIEFWSLTERKFIRKLEGHSGPVRSLAVSADGSMLASSDEPKYRARCCDHTVKLWSLPEGRLLKTILEHQCEVKNLAFSPDGSLLVGTGIKKGVIVWDVLTGKVQKILKVIQDNVSNIAFSPDGTLLASDSRDRSIILWEMPSGKLITRLFDQAAMEKGSEASQYTLSNQYEQVITYTQPCGSPIPPNAICTCNCVQGTYSPPPRPQQKHHGSGGRICSCVPVCTCVPIK